MTLQKKITLVLEQSVLKPSYSMGTGTLFVSLSYASSLLAMPAPDCPVLSWRRKRMITDYVFSGNWLSMHSEDIMGPEIAKNQADSRTMSLETFLPLRAQVHY